MKRLLKILSFNGVSSRKEWWLIYGSFWLMLIATAQIEILIFGDKENPSLLFTVLVFVSIWPLFATQVRRWHDRGKSGLWCLINIIPFIGSLWMVIELGFLPSKGTNPWTEKIPTEGGQIEHTTDADAHP
jgi:uncharacterized membrane protein YhaH (DUF805 family)